MKNPAPHIRRTVYTLLSGNVSYDGDVIPVYEGEALNGERYIVIGEYSDSSEEMSHVNGARATQIIEVVAGQSTAIKKHVDAIGELVDTLIRPTWNSQLLNGTDFHVVISRPSINHLIETGGAGEKIVRLILRYNLFIHHN